MPPLDAASLIEPVSAEAPAGPNLEYDPQFAEFERAAQGKPEQQFGDTIIPAEEPDWKTVLARGGELLDRSRDLRILSRVAVARLQLEGLPAFARTLEAVRDLLASRWNDVHPQLDPEDDNDPAVRASALEQLANYKYVRTFLSNIPLAISRRGLKFSWRDIAVATGELTPDGNDVARESEATIRAAFQDSDPDRLALLRETALAAAAAVTAIEDTFNAQAGHGRGPRFFDELRDSLGRIGKTISRFGGASEAAAAAAPAGAGPTGAAPAGAPEHTPDPGAEPRQGASGINPGAVTEVTSRADALRLLDLVCRYYQRFEPSSPLPLLIERARRLADKDFLEILRDLAPDGLGQAQVVIGSRDD